MTDEETPIFERGDVVYGVDPFKGEKDARPWMGGLINVPQGSWVHGGTPVVSRIVPWGVQSIAHEDIDFWQGRLESGLVDEAVTALVEELERTPV